MTNLNYLEDVLSKYKTYSWELFKVENKIKALLAPWAGKDLNNLITIGSTVQGTSIRKGTKDLDLDILISLHNNTPHSLKEIHDSLFKYLKDNKLKPIRRNISIKISLDGISVDLVPSIKMPGSGGDHTVYSRKKDQEFNSNPMTHIAIVKGSGRQDEIKLAKIWVYLHGLEIESFLLTLCVIEALKDSKDKELDTNFNTVLEYLSSRFMYDRYTDPCEPLDVLSDHQTDKEKQKVVEAAKEALQKDITEVLF